MVALAVAVSIRLLVMVSEQAPPVVVVESDVDDTEVDDTDVEETVVEPKVVLDASVVLYGSIVVVMLTNTIKREFDTLNEFAATVTDRGDGLLIVLIATPVELLVAYCGLIVGTPEFSVKLTTAPLSGLLSSLTVA